MRGREVEREEGEKRGRERKKIRSMGGMERGEEGREGERRGTKREEKGREGGERA